MHYEEILERTDVLLKAVDTFTSKLIDANFQIGALVSTLMDEAQYGEGAVLKLSHDLSKKRGYTVYPQRLYECARVYKTFEGDIQKVWSLERKLQSKINWSYLVRNCVKEPFEGQEAVLHWESKIARWESTLDEITGVYLKKEEIIEQIPEPVKTELRSFLEEMENPGKKPDPLGKKLIVLFKRVDALLSNLIGSDLQVDKELYALFLSVSAKIERLLTVSESATRKD